MLEANTVALAEAFYPDNDILSKEYIRTPFGKSSDLSEVGIEKRIDPEGSCQHELLLEGNKVRELEVVNQEINENRAIEIQQNEVIHEGSVNQKTGQLFEQHYLPANKDNQFEENGILTQEEPFPLEDLAKKSLINTQNENSELQRNQHETLKESNDESEMVETFQSFKKLDEPEEIMNENSPTRQEPLHHNNDFLIQEPERIDDKISNSIEQNNKQHRKLVSQESRAVGLLFLESKNDMDPQQSLKTDDSLTQEETSNDNEGEELILTSTSFNELPKDAQANEKLNSSKNFISNQVYPTKKISAAELLPNHHISSKRETTSYKIKDFCIFFFS